VNKAAEQMLGADGSETGRTAGVRRRFRRIPAGRTAASDRSDGQRPTWPVRSPPGVVLSRWPSASSGRRGRPESGAA
jgi:hypothetical protein